MNNQENEELFKAIIFDMDGLMIDTERLYFDVTREMASSRGKEIDKRINWKMMGRKPLESMVIFAGELELVDEPEKLLEERDRLMLERLRQDLHPLKGLQEILDSFRGIKKLAIATGSPMKFVNLIVDQLAVRDWFDVLQTSDDIEKGKPHPEIYLKAVAKLGLEPRECVVLEDSANGVLAARRTGCYVIAVPSEYTREQDFSHANYRTADLLEAKNYLLTMEGKRVTGTDNR